MSDSDSDYDSDEEEDDEEVGDFLLKDKCVEECGCQTKDEVDTDGPTAISHTRANPHTSAETPRTSRGALRGRAAWAARKCRSRSATSASARYVACCCAVGVFGSGAVACKSLSRLVLGCLC